jgi:Tfp pilus assembly protein PilN
MIEINLLPEELKGKIKKAESGENARRLLFLIPAAFGVAVLAHVILVAVMVFLNLEIGSLNRKWQKAEPQRKMTEEFNKETQASAAELRLIQQLLDERISWAEKLNSLSLAMPSGIWLNEASYSLNKDFSLNASVISLEKEEIRIINRFMDNLKKSPGFFKGFNNLELGSIKKRVIASYDIADFTVTGSVR